MRYRPICTSSRTALAMDQWLAQPSINRTTIDQSCCANDGWSYTADHPWPSIDACTVRHADY